MTDIVDRARAALEGVTEGPWGLELSDGQPIEHQHYHYDSMDEWYDADGGNGGWLAHCQDIPDARFIAASRSLIPELVAELERLHSWDGLMSLLDEHWTETIFPTGKDREDRDAGPRIVSLLRQLDSLRTRLQAFGTDCVSSGDMTPNAARMLEKIAKEYE